MRSRFAVPVLVVASLLGATTFASAQTKPATGAAELNAMASTRYHHHYRHHHMGYSRAQMDKSRPGGRPVSRKAPD
jgi:hypothetical protein